MKNSNFDPATHRVVFQPAQIARRVGHGLSLLLLVGWGWFFIEHLPFMFAAASTILTELFHFGLLVGYLASLRWERGGSALIVVSALVFFSITAGKNFIPFVLISLIPVGFYIIAWALERRKANPAT